LDRDYDAVILSVGFESENSMTKEIRANFNHVRVIGDAVKVRKISDAIYEGYAAGFTM